MKNSILLGYFPKQLFRPLERMSEWNIEEIGSVSLCIAEGPEGWRERCNYNEWGFFANPEIAWSLVPGIQQVDFRLYAYALHPVEYWNDDERPMKLAPPDANPLSSEYELVGWDAVSRSGGAGFECSPLSCNLLADELDTNRYCLFPDLESAQRLARAAEGRGCEPGPYHVVEVWRKRDVREHGRQRDRRRRSVLRACG